MEFYDYFTPGMYNPPDAHYSQVPCSIDKEDIKSLIGRNGYIFNAITKASHIDYLWYDNTRNVIEIWGPEHNLEGAKSRLIERMNKIKEQKNENIDV